ncbi:MAG: hypothetical protein ACREQA_18655 [Candidatus Binatia bacterium]
MGMKTEDIKAELRSIADSLPPGASCVDAIYELYVRMKAAEGKKAAEENRGEKGISPITHKVPNLGLRRTRRTAPLTQSVIPMENFQRER